MKIIKENSMAAFNLLISVDKTVIAKFYCLSIRKKTLCNQVEEFT